MRVRGGALGHLFTDSNLQIPARSSEAAAISACAPAATRSMRELQVMTMQRSGRLSFAAEERCPHAFCGKWSSGRDRLIA
jgi:hypothetical protein